MKMHVCTVQARALHYIEGGDKQNNHLTLQYKTDVCANLITTLGPDVCVVQLEYLLVHFTHTILLVLRQRHLYPYPFFIPSIVYFSLLFLSINLHIWILN